MKSLLTLVLAAGHCLVVSAQVVSPAAGQLPGPALAKALQSGEVRVFNDSLLVRRDGTIVGMTKKPTKPGVVDWELSPGETATVACAGSPALCDQKWRFDQMPSGTDWMRKRKITEMSLAASGQQPLCTVRCTTKEITYPCPIPNNPDKTCKRIERTCEQEVCPK
jgi:hypothetical protein